MGTKFSLKNRKDTFKPSEKTLDVIQSTAFLTVGLLVTAGFVAGMATIFILLSI